MFSAEGYANRRSRGGFVGVFTWKTACSFSDRPDRFRITGTVGALPCFVVWIRGKRVADKEHSWLAARTMSATMPYCLRHFRSPPAGSLLRLAYRILKYLDHSSKRDSLRGTCTINQVPTSVLSKPPKQRDATQTWHGI